MLTKFMMVYLLCDPAGGVCSMVKQPIPVSDDPDRAAFMATMTLDDCQGLMEVTRQVIMQGNADAAAGRLRVSKVRCEARPLSLFENQITTFTFPRR